jgi:hypothetical protein
MQVFKTQMQAYAFKRDQEELKDKMRFLAPVESLSLLQLQVDALPRKSDIEPLSSHLLQLQGAVN